MTVETSAARAHRNPTRQRDVGAGPTTCNGVLADDFTAPWGGNPPGGRKKDVPKPRRRRQAEGSGASAVSPKVLFHARRSHGGTL